MPTLHRPTRDNNSYVGLIYNCSLSSRSSNGISLWKISRLIRRATRSPYRSVSDRNIIRVTSADYESKKEEDGKEDE